LQDKHPILFEGLHCCFLLPHKALSNRKKLVRIHNIEHEYYEHLAAAEKNLLKKYYFKKEAKKLKQFEQLLNKANYLIAISLADKERLSKNYTNVVLIGAFHPNKTININEGSGNFALYHGNLEVAENNQAAIYLVKKVFKNSSVPLIIAGKKPSSELKKAINSNNNIVLKANINTKEIDFLIENAQINILPTFQATGIKLKLLAALYKGRHCIVNNEMVVKTGLESLCSIKNTSEEMLLEVEQLFKTPFDSSEIAKRKIILEQEFSTTANAFKLLQLLD